MGAYEERRSEETKRNMICGITAIIALATVILAIIIGTTLVEYRSADSMRCVKGEIMVVNGVTMQACEQPLREGRQ